MTMSRLSATLASGEDDQRQGQGKQGEDSRDKQSFNGIIAGRADLDLRRRPVLRGKSKDRAGVAWYGIDRRHLPEVGGLIVQPPGKLVRRGFYLLVYYRLAQAGVAGEHKAVGGCALHGRPGECQRVGGNVTGLVTGLQRFYPRVG